MGVYSFFLPLKLIMSCIEGVVWRGRPGNEAIIVSRYEHLCIEFLALLELLDSNTEPVNY